jgi:hypothetical protein
MACSDYISHSCCPIRRLSPWFREETTEDYLQDGHQHYRQRGKPGLCVVDLLRSIRSGLPLDEPQAHQVLTSVATMTTSVEVLSNLASTLRTHARSMQTCIALATSKKGAQIEYYSKMHGYIVMMSTSGHPLRDEEFVSYLLAGLDEDLYPHGLYRGGSCWSGESQRPCGNHPKWLSSRHIEGFITCRTVNESQGQKLCLKGTKAKLNYRPNK